MRNHNFMNKKNLILGGVLLFLIVLAYAYQGPLKKWQSKLGKSTSLLAKIDTAKIDKMEIIKDGKTFIVENKDGKWIVSGTKGFPVKNEMITGLFNEIIKAKNLETALISTNKNKKSEFKTDDSGIIFKFYSADKQTADLVVGKSGSDFASTYVSKIGSNETYLVKASLAKYIQGDLRDASIFSTDKGKITKIRFQYPQSNFIIENKDGKWMGISPWKFSVNKDKVEKIASIMANLSAAEIPEQTFDGTGLEKNLIIVQATGDGVDNTIMIGNDNGQALFYAKKGDSDNIYLVSKETRDLLKKTIAQLR